MNKKLLALLLAQMLLLPLMAQDNFPLEGKYYRMYNTVRLPGQQLYWTSASSYAFSAFSTTENNSQVWEFVLVDNASGEFKYHIKSYETGKYMGWVNPGGQNVSLTSEISSAGKFAITKVEGEDTYTFRTGNGQGNYLFCDNPASGTEYRLDGWKADGCENFHFEVVEPQVIVYKYILFSAGMPDGATITIDGKDYKGVNAQGNVEVEVTRKLSESDITVTVGGGMGYEMSVDNMNMQINVDFRQMFLPALSVDEAEAKEYLMKMPHAYVKTNGQNMVHTKKKSEADRFLFLEDAEKVGQYYIYDKASQSYVYYTNATNGAVVKQTSQSNVKFTADKSDANTWKIVLGNDGESVTVVPGSVEHPDGNSPAWNFTGGVEDNCVLNLWTASDVNSVWSIVDPSLGTMACATTMFALPGAEYMHKLVPNAGESIVGVDFGSISTFELKEDRLSKGNSYRYVYGRAPQEEGEYTYSVKVMDAEGDITETKVSLTVSTHLQTPTPMMSWLTWNWFDCNISHDKLMGVLRGMKSKGLIDAGYNTIVIDDGWATTQTDKSKLTYNPEKFPTGITGFVQDVKALDERMIVGIYSDAGTMTCARIQPGSYGYERPHMEMWDSWGVDMLKYDFCNSEDAAYASYKMMVKVIRDVNTRRQAEGRRPFVFNICEWGTNQPWLWGAEAGGSSWRATYDQRECWVGEGLLPGVLTGLDQVRDLWMYGGVNRFNDMDMMVIGLHGRGNPSNMTPSHNANGGVIPSLTDEQYRSQMSLWCMLSSPLALTCDFRDKPVADGNTSAGTLPNPLITETDLSIMTNPDIIAINQDSLGQQAEYMEALSTGTRDNVASGYDVYVKDLSGGRHAVAVFNRSSSSISVPALNLTDLYMKDNVNYSVKNVWDGTTEIITNTLNAGKLKAYQTKVYVFSLQDNTAIGNVTSDDTKGEAPVYNMAGQRIPTLREGINVTEGKVVVKK